MHPGSGIHIRSAVCILVLFAGLAGAGCNTTRHLKEGQYLLRRNALKLETDKGITRKGELRDNIERLMVQKPNTYALGYFPYKVWLYNLRYKKYESDTSNFQLKSRTVEKPVVFDSLLMRRSSDNIRSYLFNQGYFYPRVKDTVIYRKRKAIATYDVKTGLNFLIDKTILDVDDSAVLSHVQASMSESVLREGDEFSMVLLEEERSRLANVLRDKGYFRFSQENISFTIDTLNSALLREADNAFESAINFLALQKKQKKPTLNVLLTIRADENPSAYKMYTVSRVTVYPDFISREDTRDSTMVTKMVGPVRFRYHNYYIKENVIFKHLNLERGRIYSQSDYDATITKLNQLGVFQTIRVIVNEDTTIKTENLLNVTILLSPAKKYDFSTNFEVSNGTTYTLGSALTFNVRDKNLARGANLLNTSVSGGIETFYDENKGSNFFEHFRLLTKNFGFNASVDFPKFLVPINQKRISRRNLPRTIIGFGTSLLDRVDYFNLVNTSANLTYNWKETPTNTWDLSPAFINIIRLPKVSDSFNQRLQNNEFLKNSYRENFIEGENVAFTFSNQAANRGRSYTYLRFALEEAGGLMSAVDRLANIRFPYAKYLRFDFDTRRYVNRRRWQIASRFYGGVGVPYGGDPTLPYVKQYFVGGAYSIRGWRIRTLGPGSYVDSSSSQSGIYIDRTGDIKLEMNGEYRFDVVQLFSGSIKLKGAVFADAGNIWMANKSKDFPGGEFAFNKLGRDIAISLGAGARFDLAGFFIFRLDAAFPVKRPSPTAGDAGWVFDRLDPWNPTWRSNNLILNFAIGYPF